MFDSNFLFASVKGLETVLNPSPIKAGTPLSFIASAARTPATVERVSGNVNAPRNLPPREINLFRTDSAWGRGCGSGCAGADVGGGVIGRALEKSKVTGLA